MKKSIISVALLLGIAFSCKDSFLETAPYGSTNEAVLSSNEKGADALLIAAYSNLDGFSGWDNGTPWGSAASDWTFGSVAGGDAYKGSEANDQPDITPIERHEANENNPYLEAYWRTYYDGISRANKAIVAWAALKEKGVVDAAKADKRLGEARFLRAYYHLNLTKHYGKVPFIDETLADVRIGNDADITPKIKEDLNFAIDKLPLSHPGEPGRATKGAANVVRAYVELWAGQYAAAKPFLDAVINSGVYSLNATFHENFNPAYRNTSESVLEVQQSVNNGTDDNANNGDVLNFPYNGGPGGCCGFHQPSQNLVNAFKTINTGVPDIAGYNSSDVTSDQGVASTATFTPYAGEVDPRLDWTVGRRGIPYLDWGKHPGAAWVRDQVYGGPYSPIKNVYYKSQEGNNTTTSGWTKGFNNNNVKLIRYADVLLMAAECEVEANNLAKALEYVNKVRKRAANPAGFVKDGANPAANYVVREYTSGEEGYFDNQTNARNAVRFERRLELGMEGHRFFDLVRWGIAATEKNAYFAVEKSKRTYLTGAAFVAGKDEVVPIPRKAITQSAKDGAPTLKQNQAGS